MPAIEQIALYRALESLYPRISNPIRRLRAGYYDGLVTKAELAYFLPRG